MSWGPKHTAPSFTASRPSPVCIITVFLLAPFLTESEKSDTSISAIEIADPYLVLLFYFI